MVSAGAVYEYRQTQLAGWYWVSLVGVVLILIAGWVIPPPVAETAGKARG